MKPMLGMSGAAVFLALNALWIGPGQAATLPIEDAAGSSQYTEWEATKVKDGETGWGHCWSSSLYSDSAHTEYIAVKLQNSESGENHAVSSVTLTPRPDGRAFPKDFTIEYSTDPGNTWYAIPCEAHADYATPSSNTPITFSFDPISAYYIRIRATELSDDGSGNYAFQLDEIRVGGQDRMWPFHSSMADHPGATYGYKNHFDADVNNMFSIYGIARNEDQAQQMGSPWSSMLGGVCFWGESVSVSSHVLADKLGWLDHWWTPSIAKGHVHNIINSHDDDGYVWLSSTTHDYMGEGWHFDTNSKSLIGVGDLNCWNNDLTWLTENIDTLRSIMNYQLQNLNGANGLLIINDPNRPASGEYQNDGRFFSSSLKTGAASNYWDGWPFGYMSAYDNIYFYASLLAMYNLERQLGNWGDAEYYRSIATEVKANYNSLFWDAGKGRYIGCIDEDGAKHDYGFTFLNLEAMYYGLADQDKAEQIFSWLDGERTISGDTSTGSDIYTFKFAPRSNTLAAEAIQQNDSYWWYPNKNQFNNCTPNSVCTWGNYHENGGAIFAESFYDIMARIKYKGPDDAFQRLMAIIEEFHQDQLRRDPANNKGLHWKYGITGEYPESGLVPMVYLYGFMGISVDATNMTVKPQLPSDMSYLTAQSIKYNGAVLEITAYPNQVRIKAVSNPSNHVFYFLGKAVTGEFDITQPLVNGQATLIPEENMFALGVSSHAALLLEFMGILALSTFAIAKGHRRQNANC